MIPSKYINHRDDILESDDEPVRLPSRKTMGKRPSKDYFKSTDGKRVTPTQLTRTSVQPLNPECWDVFIFSVEKDEREPALLASKKVSN